MTVKPCNGSAVEGQIKINGIYWRFFHSL